MTELNGHWKLLSRAYDEAGSALISVVHWGALGADIYDALYRYV